MSKKPRSRVLLKITIFAISTLAVACWGMAYTMPTDAMRPTITRDDMCVANPLAYNTGEIEHFDIVVFEMPDSEKKRVRATGKVRHIKRVVGLPGDKLEIRNNQLIINDIPIEEPFEKIVSESDGKKNYGPITIPQNEYFLLGDNRPESLDSRYYEHPTIKRDDIYSKITSIKKGYYSNR